MTAQPMTLEALQHLAPPYLRRDGLGAEDLEALRDSYSYVLRFSSVEIRVTRESGQHYRIAPVGEPDRYEMVRTWKAARLAIESLVRRRRAASGALS